MQWTDALLFTMLNQLERKTMLERIFCHLHVVNKEQFILWMDIKSLINSTDILQMYRYPTIFSLKTSLLNNN
jgi:hypothetical protein